MNHSKIFLCSALLAAALLVFSGCGSRTAPETTEAAVPETSVPADSAPVESTGDASRDTEPSIPDTQTEAQVVSAEIRLIGGEKHLILVMNDGSEVDTGPVEADTPIEIFTVTFLGRDGQVLKTQTVQAGQTVQPPLPPELPGFVFRGWDRDYSGIQSNLTVTAIYEEALDSVTYFRTDFLDYDGRVIFTQQVRQGEAAQAPADPVREGWRFLGWDRDFSDVQSDLAVTARYEPLPQHLLFTAADTRAKAGQKVQVVLSLQNNPGILCMNLHIRFDEAVLSLVSCEQGSALKELSMTPPMDKRSGCICTWYAADVTDVQDGQALILTFTVRENAPSGSTRVRIQATDVYDRFYQNHPVPEADCRITLE